MNTIKPKSVSPNQTSLSSSSRTEIALPISGLSRWNQFKRFCPFSRETFRKLVNAGKAPQPVKFSQRCTAYSNEELTIFFESPLTYRAKGFK